MSKAPPEVPKTPRNEQVRAMTLQRAVGEPTGQANRLSIAPLSLLAARNEHVDCVHDDYHADDYRQRHAADGEQLSERKDVQVVTSSLGTLPVQCDAASPPLLTARLSPDTTKPASSWRRARTDQRGHGAPVWNFTNPRMLMAPRGRQLRRLPETLFRRLAGTGLPRLLARYARGVIAPAARPTHRPSRARSSRRAQAASE